MLSKTEQNVEFTPLISRSETIKPDAPICPVTRQIYKKPVKLIPLSQKNRYVGTATIEEEAYKLLRIDVDNNKICPITNLPIKGYVRNLEMEKIVADFLIQYPDDITEQYVLSIKKAASTVETVEHIPVRN